MGAKITGNEIKCSQCTVRVAGQERSDRRFYIWWSALDAEWKFAQCDSKPGNKPTVQAKRLGRILARCGPASHIARQTRFGSNRSLRFRCTPCDVYGTPWHVNERLLKGKRHRQVYCAPDRPSGMGRSHSRSAVTIRYAEFCHEENRRSPFTAHLLGRTQDRRGHEEVREHDVSDCSRQGEVAAQSARADEGARALADACRFSEQRQSDRPCNPADPDDLGRALQDFRVYGYAIFVPK